MWGPAWAGREIIFILSTIWRNEMNAYSLISPRQSLMDEWVWPNQHRKLSLLSCSHSTPLLWSPSRPTIIVKWGAIYYEFKVQRTCSTPIIIWWVHWLVLPAKLYNENSRGLSRSPDIANVWRRLITSPRFSWSRRLGGCEPYLASHLPSRKFNLCLQPFSGFLIRFENFPFYHTN